MQKSVRLDNLLGPVEVGLKIQQKMLFKRSRVNAQVKKCFKGLQQNGGTLMLLLFCIFRLYVIIFSSISVLM